MEVEICKKILDNDDFPRGIAIRGREGVIARVTSPDSMRGMVVVFDGEAPEIGATVILVDYEVRTSRAGKEYIKCFSWIPEDSLSEVKEKCKRKVIEEMRQLVLTEAPKELEPLISKMLEGNIPEDFDLGEYDFVQVAPIQSVYDEPFLRVGKDGEIVAAVGDVEGAAIIYTNKRFLKVTYQQYEFLNELNLLRGLRVYTLSSSILVFGDVSMNRVRAILELYDMNIPQEIMHKVIERILGVKGE